MSDHLNTAVAETVLDPETGEMLPIRISDEYAELLTAFYDNECRHENTEPLRAKHSNGSIHVYNNCKRCGERVGTAISQRDRDWVETLLWESTKLSETYSIERKKELEAMQLDLARRQNDGRGDRLPP